MRTALLTVLLAACVGLSVQHAYLQYPPSRNYQAFTIPPDDQKYFCPHCGQGGGTGKTPSMCGDPFQDEVGNPNFTPFTDRFYAATTLTAGQTINVRISVSTNHGGRMTLSVCPLSRGQVTQDCFNQPQNTLRRVSSNPDYNNKWYWYLSTDNNQSAETTFKLPDGVTCEGGCMLQWWWVGYQSCTLPCEDSSVDVPGECGKNPINPPVSTCSSILQTEQFANCADIIITGSGSSNSGSNNNPTVSTPGPMPSPRANSNPTPRPSPASPSSPSTPTPSPSSQGRRASPPNAPQPPSSPKAKTTTTTTSGSTGSSSQSSGDCDPTDWICQSCMQRASTNSAAAGLVGACVNCANAGVKQQSACWQCLTTSSSADVIQGCMDCVAAGNAPWACQTYCAKKASDGAAMSACASCVGTSGINNWGCGNCLDLADGDTKLANKCLACVESGVEDWACGKCLSNSDPRACFSCLANAQGDLGKCVD